MALPEISYLSGWYEEEKNAQLTYRWMSRQAKLSVKGLSKEKKYVLSFLAGHSFADWTPELTLIISGKIISVEQIASPFASYAYFLPQEDNLEIEFNLSEIKHVAGDPRDLGLMIGALQVIDLSSLESPFPLTGWYLPEEKDVLLQMPRKRWIKNQASLALRGDRNEELLLELILGHPFPIDNSPNIKIFVNNKELAEKRITSERQKWLLKLPSSEEFFIQLTSDHAFPVDISGDTRSLGLFIHEIKVHSPQKVEIVLGEGWYEAESGEFYPFHWMQQTSRLFLSSAELCQNKYLSFYAFSEYANLTQELSIFLGERKLDSFPLLHKWNFYSLDLQEAVQSKQKEVPHWLELKLALNKTFPSRYHPHDSRELGARFSWFSGHQDDELHQKTLAFHQNARLNYQEMMAGKTVLSSFPLNLGIDLYARCNIKPPCVYCLWTSMKKLEGKYVHVKVDEKTLLGYGPFFTSARTLVNCSFGEPLLHPRLKEILDLCARYRKFIEISTNGQAFTSEIIDALVGKPIFLYISLDAATRETYAKIRNDNWDAIIPRLVELNKKRKKFHYLPKIYMVFMPMKVNRGDLEEYFKLCQRIEADAVVLRPLLYLHEPKIEAYRGGYHFVYKDELLPEEEIKEIIIQARKLSKKYKIPLANQFEFGQRKEPQAEEFESGLIDFQRS